MRLRLYVWAGTQLLLFAVLTTTGRAQGSERRVHLDQSAAVERYNLGNALRHKGDLDGAIAEYRMAIHLNPNYADAHLHLGTALLIKNDLDGAIAEYRTAIR